MGVINNNTSYTNKDFNSIYSELLDIIPNITNRWNPSSEADPGVVLVKLMAVLGDKLNYNIDKQVLEMFPGSVTQRKNARQMFKLIGYNMSWYKSAEASVGFKLKNNITTDDEDAKFAYVDIPRFTKLTDAKTSVSFITTSAVRLYGEDTETIKYVKALQGNYVEHTVNNSPEIKLSNLDEDYKLYLSSINIAENGIFVKDSGTDVYDWKQVDNVDSYPLGSKVFEFGVTDDETQCYLKFPSDVNNVCISDSLSISYIVCDGYNGNIVSNLLSNFGVSILDSENRACEENIVIVQPDATTNGDDPETIEEAYKNSRKVVGTFDTLVTKKDFENYIKLLEDDSSAPIVSNVSVADRNDDPNRVVQVKSFENFKTMDRVVRDNTHITPYDLIAYMLRYQPINLDDDIEICDENYNASFQPVDDEATLLMIENMIDDVKAINIDLALPRSGEVCLYKGLYTLTAELVTSEKITQDEADELETNVKKQLEKMYQAYNMDFGAQIDYSKLIDDISSIDARIKAVSLRGIDYEMKKVVMGSTNSDVALTTDDEIDIVAKSIAKGNLQPYIFNDTFNAELGQSGSIVTPSKIKTSYTKELRASDNTALELKGGEVINLYAPKLTNTKTYTSGCKITWEPNSDLSNIEGITDGSDSSKNSYKILNSGNYYYKIGTAAGCIGTIKITYKNSEGKQIEEYLDDNLLIKLDQSIVSGKKEQTLATGNSLYVYDDDKFTLPAKTQYMLYIEGATGNKSLTAGSELLLGVNDFFVYYESSSATWVQLGSGYTIKAINAITFNLVTSVSMLSKTNNVSILSTAIEVIDNDIITLNEGCKLSLKSADSKKTYTISSNVNNYLTEGCSLYIVDTTGSYEISKNQRGVYYRAFSRLDLIFGTEDIRLYEGDKVVLDSKELVGSDIDASTYFLSFSKPVAIVGANEVAVSDLTVYYYSLTPLDISRQDGVYTLTETKEGIRFNISGDYMKCLLPIHVESGTVTTDSTIYSMDQYKSSVTTKSNSYTSGDYILSIPKGTETLTFTLASNSKVMIGKVTVVKGVNSEDINGGAVVVSDTENLSDQTQTFTKIIYALNKLCGDYKYDYTYKISNQNKCANPTNIESFFNSNHPYNKFTIAQMNTAKYTIKVNQFSIK